MPSSEDRMYECYLQKTKVLFLLKTTFIPCARKYKPYFWHDQTSTSWVPKLHKTMKGVYHDGRSSIVLCGAASNKSVKSHVGDD